MVQNPENSGAAIAGLGVASFQSVCVRQTHPVWTSSSLQPTIPGEEFSFSAVPGKLSGINLTHYLLFPEPLRARWGLGCPDWPTPGAEVGGALSHWQESEEQGWCSEGKTGVLFPKYMDLGTKPSNVFQPTHLLPS